MVCGQHNMRAFVSYTRLASLQVPICVTTRQALGWRGYSSRGGARGFQEHTSSTGRRETIVHPTALVSPHAHLGSGVTVGPFCIVGDNVVLGDNVHLRSHVNVEGFTEIGDGSQVYPYSSVGCPPQDMKYQGEDTRLVIGKNCTIRESVTISTGTGVGGGLTSVGNSCLLMGCVHIGHDCRVGSNVIIANNSCLAGHVMVEDQAVIGGLSGVHQFVKIGFGSMVGGGSAVRADIIPYGLVKNNHLAGLNLVGLKRRGVTRSEIKDMLKVYRWLFMGTVPDTSPYELVDGTSTLRERAEFLCESLKGVPRNIRSLQRVAEITSFVMESSRRGLTVPHR